MIDENLLVEFIKAFQLLDDLVVQPWDEVALCPEMYAGVDNSDWTIEHWKPVRVVTDPKALKSLYEKIPARFPQLYERLILTFRWLEVDLDGFGVLKANPVGVDFSSLVSNITADPILTQVLFPLGLIPFGKQPGGGYDQMCFDTKRRRPDGDCPVVLIEHESVLCNQEIGGQHEMFHSFRAMMEAVVATAKAKRDQSHQ
ncbi:MAG: hypothetical protein U0872_00980 [Planctomycetaceae bacterium]